MLHPSPPASRSSKVAAKDQTVILPPLTGPRCTRRELSCTVRTRSCTVRTWATTQVLPLPISSTTADTQSLDQRSPPCPPPSFSPSLLPCPLLPLWTLHTATTGTVRSPTQQCGPPRTAVAVTTRPDLRPSAIMHQECQVTILPTRSHLLTSFPPCPRRQDPGMEIIVTTA